MDSSGYITPTINIIIPPPDIRTIIDRTADYIAKYGVEFETKLREEKNSNKFLFLNKNDPYHAYYQRRVRDRIEGKVDQAQMGVSVPTSMKLIQDTPQAIQEVFETKEPPQDFEFVVDAPSINSLELDIVKLTAQYVARNGKQFLTQIMNREQRNYLFDFLRTQHNMFNYFSKLVEQYSKILLPADNVTEKLSEQAHDHSLFLKECKYRVAWERNQARIRKREMEIEDREKMAYAQIDWHDFVVVETVDQPINEVGNFPPLTLPESVGARLIAEERGENVAIPWTEEQVKAITNSTEEDDDEEEEKGQSEDEVDDGGQDDMDVNMDVSDNEDDDGTQLPPPPPPGQRALFKPPAPVPESAKASLVNPDDVIVKPYEYVPKLKPGEEFLLTSPLDETKKIIPSQASKHIKVSLLNPSWRDERDRDRVRRSTQDDATFAPGHIVGQNLEGIAARRTDIFGTEETEIGKKLSEVADRMEPGVTSGAATYLPHHRLQRMQQQHGASSKYGVDATTTASEASIRRASEMNQQQAVTEAMRRGGPEHGDQGDKIGPQATPQIPPPPQVRIIVNTGQPRNPRQQDSEEPPEKRNKM